MMPLFRKLFLKGMLVLPALLCFFPALAQLGGFTVNPVKPANLVPNPSFEEVIKDHCHWNQDGKKYMESIVHWQNPTETTPDIFSTSVPPDCWTHPKKHNDGKQRPRNGARMAGIKVYGKGGTGTFWHEYLMVELDSTLVPGEKYYAEMWVSRSLRSERASNNLGMVISDTLVNTRNRMPLYITPQVNAEEIVEPRWNGWKKVSGVFVAASAGKYLLIGNFYDDTVTETIKYPEGEGGSYYYIDDVMIRRALPGETVSPAPKPSIAPAAKRVLKVEEVVTTEEVQLDSIDYRRGNTIILERIYFEFDKSTLLPESKDELNKLHDILYDYPLLEIEIRGHTDNIGGDAYNQKLSEARAKSVVEYLVMKGTSQKRLSYKGYGSSQPLTTNDTDKGRSMNRRVEFTITAD